MPQNWINPKKPFAQAMLFASLAMNLNPADMIEIRNGINASSNGALAPKHSQASVKLRKARWYRKHRALLSAKTASSNDSRISRETPAEDRLEQLIGQVMKSSSHGPLIDVPTCGNDRGQSVRENSEDLKPYLRSSDMVQSDAPEIIEAARSITQDLKDPMSKSRAIHQWVAKNVRYDKEVARLRIAGIKEDSRQDALYTLQSGTAVCEGYADLVAALHRAIGIPSRVTLGKFSYVTPRGARTLLDMRFKRDLDSVTSLHAWNEVYINGRWITLDTTSDSGLSDGINDTSGTPDRPEFFDASSNYFNITHKKLDVMER